MGDEFRLIAHFLLRNGMNRNFEELDYAKTPLGELILRRRRVLSLDQDVYEVKLDGEFLMSSLVNDSEKALADLALERLRGRPSDVLVGGLGLGYTARTVLYHPGVRSLVVVEYLAEVIRWHRNRLVPAAAPLMSDDRCRLVNADFFALAANPELGFDLDKPGRRFDAIIVDIDHSPDYVLDEAHEGFYTQEGLKTLAEHLRPGGVFALWSAAEPDEGLVTRLSACFETVEAPVIAFRNPLLSMDDRNTIYIGSGPLR